MPKTVPRKEEDYQLLDDKIHSRSSQTERNLIVGMAETFGNKLQGWREKAHMSQAELARQLEVSPTYVSNLERDFSPTAKGGKPRPSVKLCVKIARVLGVPEAEVKAAAFDIHGAAEEPPETIEETLRNAFFFGGKGLSNEEIERLRPHMELLDREIDRLRALKERQEAPKE